VVNGFSAHPDKSIDFIGIPTRNRPEVLHRILSELSRHLQTFSRKSEVVVIDDSESPSMQAQNFQAVSQFAADPSIRVKYANVELRKRFAARLAAALGVEEEIVSFAIIGDGGVSVCTGASRNSIQLEGEGHAMLCMDDDVQCRLAVLPEATEAIALGTRSDSFWFFRKPEDVENCRFVEEDLLLLHEKLLNTNRAVIDQGTLPEGNISLSFVTDGFLKRISGGNSSVIMSLMGVAGDVALNNPLAYFVEGRENLQRLTEDEGLYRAALRNRTVLRGPRSTFISDRMGCMSYCMGVDNTEMLPPFSPIGRAQEFVWSSLVNNCVPNGLFGIMPRAILHRPAGIREFEEDAAVLGAGKFNSGEILSFIILAERPRGGTRAERLRSLSVRLRELSELPDTSLREYLWLVVRPILSWWIYRLDADLQLASGNQIFGRVTFGASNKPVCTPSKIAIIQRLTIWN